MWRMFHMHFLKPIQINFFFFKFSFFDSHNPPFLKKLIILIFIKYFVGGMCHMFHMQRVKLTPNSRPKLQNNYCRIFLYQPFLINQFWRNFYIEVQCVILAHFNNITKLINSSQQIFPAVLPDQTEAPPGGGRNNCELWWAQLVGVAI